VEWAAPWWRAEVSGGVVQVGCGGAVVEAEGGGTGGNRKEAACVKELLKPEGLPILDAAHHHRPILGCGSENHLHCRPLLPFSSPAMKIIFTAGPSHGPAVKIIFTRPALRRPCAELL
jgi:hypothetical protein